MSTQLKFDGPRLDEVLERVGRELGPQAVIVEANRGRRGGVGGFFAKEWFEVVVEAPEPPVDELDRPSSLDEALLSLADGVDDRVEPGIVRQAAPAVEVDAFAHVLAKVGGGEGRVEHGAPAPSPVVAVAPVAAPLDVPAVPRETADHAERPTTLRTMDLTSMLSVLDRIAPRVPTVLDAGSHAIVAVVGDLSAVRTVAEAIAVGAGLQASDVLVASPSTRDDVPSWLRIDGAATAAARVQRWRRREAPVVVAVELTPGRDGHAWAAEVLGAIGADEVRLVARAWQVTDELGPKATVLGGVDGLELVEVDAAGEPEAFLDLELPVMGIDGRTATPELWAALLVERRNDVAV